MLLKQKWFRALFRRRFLIAVLIVLQAGFLLYSVASGSRAFAILGYFFRIVSILCVLSVVSAHDKGAFKTLWVFLLLSFPLFGGLLYLMVHFQGSTRKMRKALTQAHEKAAPLYALAAEECGRTEKEIPAYLPQVRYLTQCAGFPAYSGTATRYFCPGEEFHKALLQELEKAQHYIFLEYFIIQEGAFWDSILQILQRKAAQGVTVRVIYDDFGCFFLLPTDYPRKLSGMGIECAAFNPFRPFLTVKQNNRDHRKIAVIDGRVAFTGGINLADEYINAYEKHGHWKDSTVMVEGRAAWSFALMFLEMWQLCKKCDEDFGRFYLPAQTEDRGFVIPYCDSPMDMENVGEHVYLQILNDARDYVYINTPYLILDDSMVSALCLAAKRGVDVHIVTPHIWDKKLVHMTTRSYYRELIRAGVKVYEYEKGFVHAKSFVSDDRIATVGTANLDFRSLYLHFECGVWLCDTAAVAQAKQDFLDTLPRCIRIREEDCGARPGTKLLQEILRLFAPLM